MLPAAATWLDSDTGSFLRWNGCATIACVRPRGDAFEVVVQIHEPVAWYSAPTLLAGKVIAERECKKQDWIGVRPRRP